MKRLVFVLFICAASNAYATCYVGAERDPFFGQQCNTYYNQVSANCMAYNVFSVELTNSGLLSGNCGQTCTSCTGGANSVSKVASASCGSYFYTDCELPCASCSGVLCANTALWADYGVGYRRRRRAVCQCGACVLSGYEYSCAAGWYGSSINGTTGCTQCPDGGTSDVANGPFGVITNTTQSSCYMPSNSTGSDDIGDFTHTENCYYVGFNGGIISIDP